jgi:hypothetical protein
MRSLGKSIKLDVVLKGKRLNAVIDTAAIITLINERFIAPHKLVSAELIKLEGLGSQIVHGRLLKDICFETGHLLCGTSGGRNDNRTVFPGVQPWDHQHKRLDFVARRQDVSNRVDF